MLRLRHREVRLAARELAEREQIALSSVPLYWPPRNCALPAEPDTVTASVPFDIR